MTKQELEVKKTEQTEVTAIDKANPNLAIYNKYRAVPQNALKSFDNGKFKGTDINTMWRIKCLTETFGICGFGWYFDIVRTWVETTTNQEQFAFAEIKLYIKYKDEWSKPISGTGGNKLTRITRDGDYSTSDEAFKMAITDALGVACRSLGIGADVYWANDKTKYTENQTQQPFKEELDQKLLDELKSLNNGVMPDLKGIAIYVKKKSVDYLTNNDLVKVIEAKKKAMQKLAEDKHPIAKNEEDK